MRPLARSPGCVLARDCLCFLPLSHTHYLCDMGTWRKTKRQRTKRIISHSRSNLAVIRFYSSHFDKHCAITSACVCVWVSAPIRTRYLNCVHYSFVFRFQQTGNFGKYKTHTHTAITYIFYLYHFPPSFARVLQFSCCCCYRYDILNWHRRTECPSSYDTHISVPGNMYGVYLKQKRNQTPWTKHA